MCPIFSANIFIYPFAMYFSLFLNNCILSTAKSSMCYEMFQKSNSTSQFPSPLLQFRSYHSLPLVLAAMPLMVPSSGTHSIYHIISLYIIYKSQNNFCLIKLFILCLSILENFLLLTCMLKTRLQLEGGYRLYHILFYFTYLF